MDNQYHYPGQELAIFEKATNWKKYFAKKIAPFIGKNVLEVGAGRGSTTKILHRGSANLWTMLEPDEKMYQHLIRNQSSFPANTIIKKGRLEDVDENFDTILYIDVLEHIENDGEELKAAAKLLVNGGNLIVLSPAYRFLYSEFDKAIGHYRRYQKSALEKITPAGLKIKSMKYLDSLGFFASLINKYILHQSYPYEKQVEVWDKKFIPVSKIADRVLSYSFGKTILAVWEKQ